MMESALIYWICTVTSLCFGMPFKRSINFRKSICMKFALMNFNYYYSRIEIVLGGASKVHLFVSYIVACSAFKKIVDKHNKMRTEMVDLKTTIKTKRRHCILIILYHNKIHSVWTWNFHRRHEKQKKDTQKNRKKTEQKKTQTSKQKLQPKNQEAHNRQYKYLLCVAIR